MGLLDQVTDMLGGDGGRDKLLGAAMGLVGGKDGLQGLVSKRDAPGDQACGWMGKQGVCGEGRRPRRETVTRWQEPVTTHRRGWRVCEYRSYPHQVESAIGQRGVLGGTTPWRASLTAAAHQVGPRCAATVV